MKRKRATTTAVFLGVDRVLRVDLDEHGQPLEGGTVERALNAVVPLAEGLEIALQSDAAPAPRTVVIAELLWTQTIEVGRASIHGLSTDETARALAFEAEPLSNVPAFDSVLAYTLIGSRDGQRETAWITVLRMADRNAIEDVLRQHGSRLAGLVHPAGLVTDGDGTRIEVWELATASFESGAPTRTLVLSARPGQRSWEKGLSDWIRSSNAGRIAWSGRARASSLNVERALDDQGPGPFHSDWAGWLAAAANSALRHDALAPVVHSSPKVRRTLGAGVFCALLCALAFGYVGWRYQASEVRAADVEERAGRLEKYRSDAKEAEVNRVALAKHIDELRTRIAKANTQADGIEREWSAQSKRLLALASEVALRKPAGITITSVEPDDKGGVDVNGIGIDGHTIQDFSASLEPGLSAAYWKPLPARSTEKISYSGKSYYEFTISIDQPSASGTAASNAGVAAKKAPPRRRND